MLKLCDVISCYETRCYSFKKIKFLSRTNVYILVNDDLVVSSENIMRFFFNIKIFDVKVILSNL